ncbi:MAG TPA: hypothetical protein VGW39_15470 [Chthoniobacterales bacterium]|nr:hypothetical protein [Chthoniobacterales bacterium]
MPVATKLQYASIDQLSIDPSNPRLGSEVISQQLKPDQLLRQMRDWELEELAVSFLESGFWPQEALLVVEETLYGERKPRLVVVEGNRRLAALKYLREAINGHPATPRWTEIVSTRKTKVPKTLFEEVPYLVADHRQEISAYLGFRHVSGIKEWDPPEKAAFIAKMIDEQKLTYEQVMRRIGSKTEPVRRNYISYRILLQMKEHDEQIDLSRVEERFSVLFLSLRTRGVQKYLKVDIEAAPGKAKRPIPPDRVQALIHFARWLFGYQDVEPIVSDSRQVDKFDKALNNKDALAYLERTKEPHLDVAYRLAGGEEWEAYEELEIAATHLRSVLGVIHLHRKSSRIRDSVEKVVRASFELLRGYPEMHADLLQEQVELGPIALPRQRRPGRSNARHS